MTPQNSSHLFDAWLDKNQDRLPTQLKRHRRLANGAYDYRFLESPALRVVVWEGSLSVEVLHEQTVFDTLLDIDIDMKRDEDGMYSCLWCKKEGHPARYPDPYALLEAHTFEPFLEWCIENLREDRVLVLEFVPGHWSSASIRDSSLNKSSCTHYEIEFFGPRCRKTLVEKVLFLKKKTNL